jgi:hypothetical protein
MRTYREAYADYMVIRKMVEDAGGIRKASPELLKLERERRDEAARLAASAAHLTLDGKARRN